MAIDLTDLVMQDLDAAADRLRGHEFAEERGAAVVARVRRRRVARAAGGGAVALVITVVLAAVAWAAPWRISHKDVSPATSESPAQSPLPTLEVPDAPVPLPQAGIVGDSPFECGYAFPSAAGAEGYVEAVSVWVTSRDDAERLVMADLTDPVDVLPGDRNAGVATAQFSINPWLPRVAWAAQDPGVDTVAVYAGGEADGDFAGTSLGFGFVAVRDGVVVGSDRSLGADDPQYATYLMALSRDASLLAPSRDEYRLYLFDPAGAITSCAGDPLDWSSVDLYAVAGAATFGEGQVLERVDYSWRRFEPQAAG